MASKERLTIGLNLGDITSRYCILNEAGEVVVRGSSGDEQSRDQFVIRKDGVEPSGAGVGTNSPWVSRQIARRGHEVIRPIRTR